jgi:hypothetical protein
MVWASAHLTQVAGFVADLANLALRNDAPFVGRSAFAHKGGIHVSAVLKESATYEHIQPEIVGNRRRVLISDLSGRSNIFYKLKEKGLSDRLTDDARRELLEKDQTARARGYELGREGTFELLVRETLHPEEFFSRLRTSRSLPKGRRRRLFRREHDDPRQGWHALSDRHLARPVHAMDLCLRRCLSKLYPQIADIRLMDYKVRVLDSKRGTAARVRVLIEWSDHKRGWATVGVSKRERAGGELERAGRFGAARAAAPRRARREHRKGCRGLLLGGVSAGARAGSCCWRCSWCGWRWRGSSFQQYEALEQWESGWASGRWKSAPPCSTSLLHTVAAVVKQATPSNACILFLTYTGPEHVNYYKTRFDYHLPAPGEDSGQYRSHGGELRVRGRVRDVPGNLQVEPFGGHWDEQPNCASGWRVEKSRDRTAGGDLPAASMIWAALILLSRGMAAGASLAQSGPLVAFCLSFTVGAALSLELLLLNLAHVPGIVAPVIAPWVAVWGLYLWRHRPQFTRPAWSCRKRSSGRRWLSDSRCSRPGFPMSG